jgi:hypothetical protein
MQYQGNVYERYSNDNQEGWVRRVGVSGLICGRESNVDAIVKVKVDAKRFVQNGGFEVTVIIQSIRVCSLKQR